MKDKLTTSELRRQRREYTTFEAQITRVLLKVGGSDPVGIFLYIFDKPDSWKVYEADVMKACKMPRKRYQKAMKILKHFGLVERRAISKNGRLSGRKTVVRNYISDDHRHLFSKATEQDKYDPFGKPEKPTENELPNRTNMTRSEDDEIPEQDTYDPTDTEQDNSDPFEATEQDTYNPDCNCPDNSNIGNTASHKDTHTEKKHVWETESENREKQKNDRSAEPLIEFKTEWRENGGRSSVSDEKIKALWKQASRNYPTLTIDALITELRKYPKTNPRHSELLAVAIPDAARVASRSKKPQTRQMTCTSCGSPDVLDGSAVCETCITQTTEATF